MQALVCIAAGALLLPLSAAAQEPPPLPAGLGQGAEAALPAGADQSPAAPTAATSLAQLQRYGFIETRLGRRLRDAAGQKDSSLGEVRLQLGLSGGNERGQLSLVSDFVYDPVLDRHGLDLDTGQGWLDLRELSLLAHPAGAADVKIGRQILTWGTGDLLFINDLFPKDWNAFMIGRDEDYLKAPSDAVKLSLYGRSLNLDLVYMPVFDGDRFIDGARLYYFNPQSGAVVGREQMLEVARRDAVWRDDEVALRAYRLLGAREIAAYYYRGYWKSPAGFAAAVADGPGRAIFPRLAVYGASLRTPLGGGIAYAEVGLYDSLDDGDGDDGLINNSEWRFLLGYERELAPAFTGALQFYRESMRHYRAYKNSLPGGAAVRVRDRDVLTLRLTRQLLNQTLTLSLFNFWSPADDDGYLRLRATYQAGDSWRWEIGANLFHGQRDATFFGQLRDNSNAFAALRFSF